MRSVRNINFQLGNKNIFIEYRDWVEQLLHRTLIMQRFI